MPSNQWTPTSSAGGGGVSSAVLTATVQVSSAQILAMDVTPVVLVAGVAGKAIVPMFVGHRLHAGATPYNTYPTAQYFNGVTIGTAGWGAASGQLPVGSAVDAASFINLQSSLQGDTEALTLLSGAPLSMDTPTAATTGNGTLTCTTLYYLLDVT